MRKGYGSGVVAAVCLFISVTTVRAEEPFTAGKTQLGAGLNLGFVTSNETDSVNPYGLGLGVDFGHTLGVGVYLGGEFNYFFGTTHEEFGVETSTNMLQFGVELGYDMEMGSDLVFRPKAGLGVAEVDSDVDGGDYVGGDSDSGLFIPVGFALLGSVGNGFIGGDVRYGIAVDDTDASGVIIGFGAGFAF